MTEVESLRKECVRRGGMIDRLMRIIARELKENDELGSEYTYVLALKNQVFELEATVKELCEVKIIKDVQGRTPEYYRRRDAVWEKAFAFFPEYETPHKTCCPDEDRDANGECLSCNPPKTFMSFGVNKLAEEHSGKCDIDAPTLNSKRSFAPGQVITICIDCYQKIFSAHAKSMGYSISP